MADGKDGASAPPTKPFRWKSWLGVQSSRLSHTVFAGLVALAAAPHFHGVTRIELPLVTASPPALADAHAPLQHIHDAGPDALSVRGRQIERDVKVDGRPAREALRASTMPLQSLSPLVAPDAAVVTVEPDDARPVRERLIRLRVRTLPAPAEPAREAAVSAPKLDTPTHHQAASDAPIGVVKKRVAYTVVPAWSEEQIADARKACASLLSGVDITASEAAPVREGTCGAPAPVTVSRVGAPKVAVQPAAMMTCPMAAALHEWLTDKVQPAAKDSFGSPVVRLLSASSYSCRNRYGKSQGALSEHASANALDLAGFVLADGRTIRVVDGWGPVVRDRPPTFFEVAEAPRKPPLKGGLSMLGGVKPALHEGEKKADKTEAESGVKPEKPEVKVDEAAIKRMAFLKAVHRDACGIFGTVLGPEANAAHSDHFHLDMKQRKHRSYCQ